MRRVAFDLAMARSSRARDSVVKANLDSFSVQRSSVSPDLRIRALDTTVEKLCSISPHTLSGYERDLRRLQSLAGGVAPADLTALDLRRFVGRLHASGLSGRSIARSLSAWRGLLRWLAKRGLLDANVAEGLHAPKLPKRLPNALSVDEAFRLLNTQA